MARPKKVLNGSKGTFVPPSNIKLSTPVAASPVAVEEKRQFEYRRLSASMAKTFMQCKRKFYSQYVLGKEQAPQEHFTLGTAAHAALEAANKSLLANPRQLNPFEVEEFVQVFRDEAAAKFLQDMGTFSTGEDVVRTELAASNTREKLLAAEDEFELVTPEGVKIYGFIDKVTELNSSTIKITDYKTSMLPMSHEESKTDIQLAMYDLAYALKYPQYETRVMELKYLRTGESLKITRSEVEQQNFRLQLLSIHKSIVKFLQETKAEPKGDSNSYCNYCSFRQACPQYVAQLSTYLPSTWTPSHELTSEKAVELWDKINYVIKAAEDYKDQLKIWVARQFEMDHELVLTDGERQLYTYSSSRREYDVVKIGKAIGLDDLLGKSTEGVPLVKITNKILEKYLETKDDPKLNKKVETATAVKFNSPTIKTKKA